MPSNEPKTRRRKPFAAGAAVAALVALCLLFGCYIDLSRYGEYQRRQEVADMFKDRNLPPDYAYYYVPSASRPEAVLGIAPGFTLTNTRWHRADSSELKKLMDGFWIPSGVPPFIHGSYIRGPDGKIIGIYYSRWQGGPVVVETDNTIYVHLPDIRDEDPDDRDFIFRRMND